jgi:peptidoglycan/LPS O-acetylase OafA/YrhL
VLLTEYRGSGSIDLFRFWMRRARRLLPALFLVLVAVSVWVSVGAAEFELGRRRSDLLSALFYGSNWHLISSGDDYFTWFATASPVRHTWSLSIEEQFYLLWPLLLLLVLRFVGTTRRRVAAFGAAGIVGSLVSMALLYSPAAPSRAYYGTDARIHQVLIGALLAIAVSEVSWSGRQRRVGAVVSVAAVAAVLLAFWTVSDSDAFYYFGGSAAVALAAAALVWGVDVAPNGPVAREFALRPVRWIGKISYGVYLWHWPVVVALTSPAPAFAWLPERFGTDATRILFTFAFAFLSFYVIERPVREGTVRMLGRPAFRMAVASVAGFAVVTAAVMVATRVEVSSTSGSMFGGREIDQAGCELEICVRYRAADRSAPVVALIGDSTARSLDVGLIAFAHDRGWTYVSAASDGCRITHLLSHFDGESDPYRPCYEATPTLFAELPGSGSRI